VVDNDPKNAVSIYFVRVKSISVKCINFDRYILDFFEIYAERGIQTNEDEIKILDRGKLMTNRNELG
jgi:hypothetical protein